MRIVHIGHGRIPIPPTASGAVEAIISDYRHWCERLGHEFLVVNEKDPHAARWAAWVFSPDVIHLHDETKVDELSKMACSIKIVTTHDPTFFEKPNPFIKRFVEGDFIVGCLCQRYADEFVKAGVAPERILLTPNGARGDLIRFKQSLSCSGGRCGGSPKMVCLGAVGERKRQKLLFPFRFVNCIGPVMEHDPVDLGGRIFNEWQKESVYSYLTNYDSLVLISKSEAAPLVVVEALMAGLDVVVSEPAAANLDRSQPFIHVLDERTITNPIMLEMALKKVLARTKDRRAVRDYAEENFDWSVLVKRYLSELWKRLRSTATATNTK